MKVQTINGVVTVTSENKKEAIELFTFAISNGQKDTVEKVSVEKTTKRKKYCVKKVCDRCGKVCKGAMGIDVHMSSAHGVKAKKYVPKTKVSKNESYLPISITNKTGGYLS